MKIVYLREGRLHRVRARSVVLANGNWTINSVVRDLPADYRHAYAQFFRAPCIMANVAVHNWRFLARMGISQCQWFDGIGNYLAVRRVATFGGGAPALSPDSPTVLTLKILFASPGKSLPEQINTGRYQMMTTPFSVYEKQIREQFTGEHVRQAGIRSTARHRGHHPEPLGPRLPCAAAGVLLRQGGNRPQQS